MKYMRVIAKTGPMAALFLLTYSSALTAQTQEDTATNSAKPEKPSIVGQFGLFYKPNDVEAGVKIFKPGDNVFQQPAYWSDSAKVSEFVKIKTSKGEASIPDGMILPAVAITGLPGTSEIAIVYCTPPKKMDAETSTRMFGVLGRKIADSLSDGQKCLYDKDGDGSAELGFLLNDGTAEDRVPQPITPIALNVMKFRKAGLDYWVSLKLDKAKRPTFSLDMMQNGKKAKFYQITVGEQRYPRTKSVDKNSVLPIDFSNYGAKFRIISHDPKSGETKIEFSGQDKDQWMMVPTETEITVRFTPY